MSDLVEFLRARIAEDEERALGHRKVRGDIRGRPCPRCGEPATGYGTPLGAGVVRVTHSDDTFGCDLTDEEWVAFGDGGPTDEAQRRLAECDAKRTIIATWQNSAANVAAGDANTDAARAEPAFHHVMKILASLYADHPDWLEEWRP